jgi:hypothetical protein
MIVRDSIQVGMLILATDNIPFGGVVQWLQRRLSASTITKKIRCPQRRRRGDGIQVLLLIEGGLLIGGGDLF